MAGIMVFGAGCLTSASAAQPKFIVWAAAPVIAAILLQLLPLPRSVVHATGTGIGEFLENHDVAFAVNAQAWHSLSISPLLTVRAALIFIALVTFVCALVARLNRSLELCRSVALAVVVVALPVALFALIQKATFNGKIYWFWESEFKVASNYYGPFVNRNHFAGWMLLATALTGGFVVGQIQTIGRRVKSGWRDRLLWLSSGEASRLILVMAALLIMLISILWSMSRAGMAGTGLAFLVLGLAALRRVSNGPRKLIAVGTVVLLLLLSVIWRGADTLASWYSRTQTLEWRVQLWEDTVPAIRDFWLTGSGINTYSSLMLMYPQTDLTVHAVQAHSDYIQLTAEGGLLVGLPAVILLGLLIREIRLRLKQPQDEWNWWIRMGAVAGICGMALQETVEFSLQIPGIAVLFALLVAIAIHEPAGVRRS
jgi:O-antigen ligase